MKGSASTCDHLNGPTGCCAVSNEMQREEQTLRGCAQVYREAPYLKGRRTWLLDLEVGMKSYSPVNLRVLLFRKSVF